MARLFVLTKSFVLFALLRLFDCHPLMTGRENPVCKVDDGHHRSLGNWSAFRDSANPYPYLPHQHERITPAVANTETTAGVSRRECYAHKYSRTSEPLWARSLCPWVWRENYDANRVPAVLLEAHCQCDRSVVTSALAGDESRTVYECENVYYNVRVLKLNQLCEFKPAYEEVSIACTAIISARAKAFRGPLYNEELPGNSDD